MNIYENIEIVRIYVSEFEGEIQKARQHADRAEEAAEAAEVAAEVAESTIPFQIKGNTLHASQWFQYNGQWTYLLHDVNIKPNSLVSAVPDIDYIEAVSESEILPVVDATNEMVIFYAAKKPENDIVVHLTITSVLTNLDFLLSEIGTILQSETDENLLPEDPYFPSFNI